ncbi:hypothetical protein GCM10010174_78130 [Kutzneria viridogrisea]|uniref:Beta-ketoacyl synthase N-terminal domain-containing protein n=2 Tax=Kutzneria TaxID=43356 RepID=W5WBR8_9PSEU|nr:hypothetical protein [Kutzneria albida]AHH95624.1 hypothetical protein KALB_2255 [Kutzneria albida DSM 43870]MBA8927013.1 hypothetical protein [Kutzneria viridogrisea]
MTLRVRSSAKVDGPVDLPAVPGFIESTFNPLVHHVATNCLAGQDIPGDRLAVVLGSLVGDCTTTDLASRLLVQGQVHNALLFMQATANAVLGYLSREFDITGPLLALSTMDGMDDELLDTAELLLADPGLDAVLVLGVELVPTERAAHALSLLPATAPRHDLAIALLLERHPEEP